jgi:hypothetical protein
MLLLSIPHPLYALVSSVLCMGWGRERMCQTFVSQLRPWVRTTHNSTAEEFVEKMRTKVVTPSFSMRTLPKDSESFSHKETQVTPLCCFVEG